MISTTVVLAVKKKSVSSRMNQAAPVASIISTGNCGTTTDWTVVGF